MSEKEQEQRTYRVVRGVIQRPRLGSKRVFNAASNMIHPGEIVPPGLFPQEDLEAWERDGRIKRVDYSGVSAEQVLAEQRTAKAAPKFTVDPSTLIGKSLDELRLMVLDIQPGYDASSLESEAGAVRLLTSEWDPKYAAVVPPAADRARPEALALHNLEQTERGAQAMRSTTKPASEKALDVLAEARRKAQAPEGAEE